MAPDLPDASDGGIHVPPDRDAYRMTPTPSVTLARDADGFDHTRQSLARKASSGSLQRVARGAYADAAEWAVADNCARYRSRIVAAALTSTESLILSHWSAAALHGLPILGAWPTRVHAVTPPGAGGRSRAEVIIHASHSYDEHVVEVDGLRVTSLARTLVDIAAQATFDTAVVMVDHALFVDPYGRARTSVTREILAEVHLTMLPFRGHSRVGNVLAFAESGAQTPIESVSRVTMWRIGCPRPELQHLFHDAAGLIGASDFHWRRERLAGEADGATKYLDVAHRSGRSVEQVLLDEKLREDRIRAQGDRVSRWPWAIARNEAELREHLTRAGLTMGRRWPIE